jgi:hypothetical protein
MLDRDLAERREQPGPGIGEQNVEPAAFGFHRCVQPVEVGHVSHRAPDRARRRTQLRNGCVERLLPPPEEVDERAFVDEPFRRSKSDAGSTARHHCRLAF